MAKDSLSERVSRIRWAFARSDDRCAAVLELAKEVATFEEQHADLRSALKRRLSFDKGCACLMLPKGDCCDRCADEALLLATDPTSPK